MMAAEISTVPLVRASAPGQLFLPCDQFWGIESLYPPVAETKTLSFLSLCTVEKQMALAAEVIVTVRSDTLKWCPVCQESLDGIRSFDSACEHMLSHLLKCLHVGQETRNGRSGPHYCTVAVFAR